MGDNGGVTPSDGEASDAARPVVDVTALANALVYAPLGLALEARTLMPRFIERGRNHVAMARMIGQFAVRKGSEDVAAGVLAGQERLLGVLRSTGVIASEPDASHQAQPTGGDSPQGGDAAGSPLPQPPQPAGRATAEAAAQAQGIASGDLPIEGYDLLSASQVVPRLDGLSDVDLELIQRYEAGTRARRTILSKVAQLRHTAPSSDGT